MRNFLIERKFQLVMTLLVRDKVDIIRENINYHLKHGVDFIIATDNGSVDGTREVLEEYSHKGCLYLIDEKGQNFAQSEWVNRMGKIAYEELKAEITFHCDADEFWVSKTGSLKDEISSIEEGVLNVNLLNVLLENKGGEEEFPQDAYCLVTDPIETDFEGDSKYKKLTAYKSDIEQLLSQGIIRKFSFSEMKTE